MNAQLEIKRPPLRRGDYYYIPSDDGDPERFVSVTTALTEVAKPGLTYWAAQTAARAALDNPNLSVREAAQSIYQARDSAGNRGGLIHSWIDAYLNGHELNPDNVPGECVGFALAFMRFVKREQPVIKQHEFCVFNRTHGYAGTVDALAAEADDDRYLIDFKTSKGVYDEAAFQLSAYRHAEAAIKIVERTFHPLPEIAYTGVVHLRPDGTYAWHELPDRFPEFLAYLHIWRSTHDLDCPPACWCKTFRGAA